MQAIVVGVEGSGRSDEALVAALELARGFECELELVHGVRSTGSDWPFLERSRHAALDAEAVAGAQAAMAAHLRTRRHEGSPLKHRGEPIEERLRAEVGLPAKLIVERAQSTRAGLVVLGRHRRRGLIDLGGTARSVIAKSPCPVWIQNGAWRGIRSILCPVDLSEHSLAALQAGIGLAQHLGAKIRALYCFVHPGYTFALDSGAPMVTVLERVEELRRATRDAFERRMESLEWRGVPHETHFVEDEPVQGILAMQDAADLIALGTHGASGFAASVIGGTAWGVLRASRVPVLVLPHPERAYELH